MQFVVFEKFTSAYLFQITREKSCDYLLIICKQQFLSRVSSFGDRAAFNFLTASLTCLYIRKYLFTLCKSCMNKFNFRTNHLSVESEDLEKGIFLRFGWRSRFTTFTWIKETPCVFLHRTETDELHDALTNQITEILNENLCSEPFSARFR